jgi:hypothetical protein
VLPLLDVSVPYEDVYTLNLPFAPPGDLRQQLGNPSQEELARLFHAPKVAHKARLKTPARLRSPPRPH